MGAPVKGSMMDNLLLYLLMIVIPLAILIAATVVVRRNRLDTKYRDEAAARRRAEGDGRG
ncbi:MAG TPA: hypothetical protein VFJ97_15460 [Dermatophilaceae bacterium]|nr:hypothetical protein [Dermatophilaceae bacterium]